MSRRIAFLGNFDVSYSSENHHAASLEELGYTVTRLQERRVTWREVVTACQGADMLVWVHTHGWDTPGMELALDRIRDCGVPVVTYHLDLWMGLQRQRDMGAEPYWTVDHFFTADRLMAEWLNNNTAVKGHYLPAGVFHSDCYRDITRDDPFDVVFVGSRGYHEEWPYRPQLIDWLATTYGKRFRHYGGDGIKTVRSTALNRVYGNAKVAVGDSLCQHFSYPDYWSDRVYECMGRGGFLIMPKISGLEKSFVDKRHLVYYDFGDFDQLRDVIDYYVAADEERESIRIAGHNLVREKHTYLHRWQTILDVVTQN